MKVDFINQFFFGYYPYICLTIFIVGSFLRYDRDQYTWKADSSQLLRKKHMLIGNNFFHVGILFLFFGHLVGLLTPHYIYEPFISAGAKQLLAMIAGGVFGVICFIGMTMLLYRRLFDERIRSTSHFSDILVLVILYIQLILGLISIFYSFEHLDGSSMVALGNWAQKIVTFQFDASQYIVEMSWVFKTHITLGLTIFIIFPFTRLVHVFSGFTAPFRYLMRTGYQIVRKRD